MNFSLFISFLINFETLLGQFLTQDDGPRVTTTLGPIKGKSVEFRGSKVYQFLNIPYAEPPINDLRFKKPISRKPWYHELTTDQWGPHCMQPNLPSMNSGYQVSEDCLTLNVFTSARAFHEGVGKPRPVMVWIHGGGFIFGSANAHEHYDGTTLTGLKDVILVSINYRLGPFGFLYLPQAGVPGNMGLWDQLLALQWVRDNIAKFGGDPNQVTIFGESAGSISVSAHIVSPQSKGLFKNAIMQSGSIFDIDRWTIDNLSSIFLEKIGCVSTDLNECLDNYRPRENFEADVLLFWPVYGDEFLPEKPEASIAKEQFNKEINLLVGTVGNEGAVLSVLRNPNVFNPIAPEVQDQGSARHYLVELFGESTLPFYLKHYLYDEYEYNSTIILLSITAALGDTYITCPTYAFARDVAEASSVNVYAYLQTQRPSSRNIIGSASSSTWMPASHCNDIPMVFGHPFLQPDEHNVDDALLSSLMMDAWVTFARTGKPPAIGQTEWVMWHNNVSSYPTMVLDVNQIGVLDSFQTDLCLNNWPFPYEKGIYWSDIITPYPGPLPYDHVEF